jgi:hypothetical protein
MVERSQFAVDSPAAKRLRKQLKSLTFRTGAAVEWSQLGSQMKPMTLEKKRPKLGSASWAGPQVVEKE